MRKAIMADHKLISAYVELADYYAQRFDFFPANEMLKKAQSLQPNNFEVFRGFALVALRRNDFKAADGYGARALKIYEADIDTLLLMAKANIGLLQYTEAQNYVGRAMDLDSSNVEALSLNAKITAAIHGVDAGARYVRDRLNQIVITQGHQIPQEAIDLRITLGEIYMQDERYRPAEEVIRQAVSLDPNSKRALVALAKSLQAQGLATQALEFFLKAAVMDPSDAEPLFFSGQLYASTRNWGEAYKQFERVLRVNPRFPKAHTALGRVSLSQGDNKKAIEEALLERQINPDLPDAYLLSAEAYFNLKQYSNCAGEYQKAISKHGQTAVTLVRMARCYRLTGALDSAQSLLHEATAIESGNPDIYKEQGAIFHTKALADEAIGAYDTYLRLAPNAIDRAEVESRIRKIQAGDMTFSD
jgi:tetratricopeptide (TPR) repeat protein